MSKDSLPQRTTNILSQFKPTDTKLNLYNCGISDDNMNSFVQFLLKNVQITHLNLSINRFKSQGMKLLVTALAKLTQLEVLILSRN